MREVAKKLLTVVALVLVLGGVVCCHVHNEECGYDEQTGKGVFMNLFHHHLIGNQVNKYE